MLMVGMLLAGCAKQSVEIAPPPPVKEYAKALPPGASALRMITNPADWPDFKTAFNARDPAMAQALDRSIKWYQIPITTKHFPICGITHAQAWASALAFKHLMQSSASPTDFERQLHDNFDVYTSVGWDNQGTVLFTGYYTPILDASPVSTGEFRYPLYRKPADMPPPPQLYATRRELEAPGRLSGLEFVWLRTRFEQYLAHIQGSAQLRMPDGSARYVGYAATNGHEYTSIAKQLVADGKLDVNRLSLSAVKGYFQQNPGDLDRYIQMNNRFVFFQEYQPDTWPAGSLGFRVTPMNSIATDKSIFPRGGVTFVAPASARGGFPRFMVDQDTGGAIRAAGRADVYFGIGENAEREAGNTYVEGRLYYLFLKPGKVEQWAASSKAAAPHFPSVAAID